MGNMLCFHGGQAPSEWSEIFGTYIRTNLILSASIRTIIKMHRSKRHSLGPTILVGCFMVAGACSRRHQSSPPPDTKYFQRQNPCSGEDCMAQGSQYTMVSVYNGRGIGNHTWSKVTRNMIIHRQPTNPDIT